jgi:hypothetical protein
MIARSGKTHNLKLVIVGPVSFRFVSFQFQFRLVPRHRFVSYKVAMNVWMGEMMMQA